VHFPLHSPTIGVCCYNTCVTRPIRKPQGRSEPPTSPTVPTPTDSWEQVADWYDSLASEKGTDFHQRVVIPGVLRLLDLQKGENVLDVGCGQGVVSRALHQHGADVTGVDLSPRLVQMARQRSPKAIRYHVGDARSMEFLADHSFDAMACVLAAQNTDPIEPVFVECSRLLRPQGRLALVVNHPAFRIPRQSRWRLDRDQKVLYREVDTYLSPLRIPIDMKPFKEPGRKFTWTYHRPIQAYVNSLADAGLWVNCLEEWPAAKTSRGGPWARAENRARAEIPLFLAMRAVKVHPAGSLAVDTGT